MFGKRKHVVKAVRFKGQPAYEYSDVDLEQRASTIHSRKTDLDLTTRFSRRVALKFPCVSANMDTVTGSRMAIVMAEEGALGVLHRFLSIEEQVREVARVKRATHFVIDAPKLLMPQQSVGDAFAILEGEGIGGTIIVDDLKRKRVLGVLTRRDLFGEPQQQRVGDLMNSGGKRQLVTAPKKTTMAEAAKILHMHRIEKLPLVDTHGVLQGLITEKDIKNVKQHPRATRDAAGRLVAAAAVGIKQEDYLKRAAALVAAGVDVLVVDVAHGGLRRVADVTRALARRYPDVDIVAGNVMTAELTRTLIQAGAVGVKVGIAPGYACRTRNITGVGGGQLTAVMECGAVAQRFRIPVCADGGVRELGDLGKAIAAGASTVMMGSMFAGTEESPGSSFTGPDGRRYKIYRGMASFGANITLGELGGGTSDDAIRVTPEGEHLMVPAKGSARDMLAQMEGALRSTMSYIGARTIAEMSQQAIFRPKARNGA